MSSVDDAIDGLYQLPLDEFTSARNALAKELKQPEIKTLEKPSVAAWAVNQLVWQHDALFTRLLASAQALRAEHRKLLSGKAAGVRDAEKAHRDAVRQAVDAIRQILHDGGQAATPATLAAVQETLEALPSDERPGRLVRPLKPRGFEALADLPARSTLRLVRTAASPAPSAPAKDNGDAKEDRAAAAREKAREKAALKQREKAERERKARQREAEQALAAAETEMLRAEEAVKAAEKTLVEQRAARDRAVAEYQRARDRARE